MVNQTNSNNKLRVLILDDDSDFRNHFTKWTSDLGFSPVPVGNLPDAQTILERQELDVAIIDLFLSEKSDITDPKGLLLVRDILEDNDKQGKNLFIIVITSDPRVTPIVWQEIIRYIRQGLVISVLAKNDVEFKENFQTELISLDKRIQQSSEEKETNILKVVNNNLLQVFLCYSPDDKDSVRRLYKRLKFESDINPWLDEEKILPGQVKEYEIETALSAANIIIICISTVSVIKDGHVQKIIKKALDLAKEKKEDTIFVIPLKMDECELPPSLAHLQSVNLYEKNGYDKLLSALRYQASKLTI